MSSCNFILPDNTTCCVHATRCNKFCKHKLRQKRCQCPSTANKNNLCAKNYTIENDKYCNECENYSQYNAYTKCYTCSKSSTTKPKCLAKHCNKFAQSPSKYCSNAPKTNVKTMIFTVAFVQLMENKMVSNLLNAYLKDVQTIAVINYSSLP